MNRRHFLTTLGAAGLASCSKKPVDANAPLRFGHFPNITHIQGLVAHALSRQGKGWFEPRLGVPVEWFVYNAGPSATEAIFARSLDVTYIGPSPVLNAYAKSKGSEVRVLAGAATGGSALVVRPDSGINTPADFRGKRIATPQLGNTQDVQLRAWLLDNGIKVTATGGEASVLPTQNPDQLALFIKRDIDAVWTVEPWVSRLEMEAGGKIFLEDKSAFATILASSAAFITERTELAKKLIAAHQELTEWIQKNPAEARELIKSELKELTTKAPGDELLDRALSRVVLATEVNRAGLDEMVISAQKAGFLKDIPSLDALLPKL
ncbi:NitT/TauT family transport system substrate-binding protein [Prosthecobacter fusiformis]|uniref:NitT/TauT family transport system substrate-binding protein n=1 Tax=Prosthecobacter fusiformis TaxID=48464 RepID=A0A4R7S001_9BACT|nr:ABC transporter substrate-binding protein [Prosthecobacter fusiformis]TDU70746.1 NitT/TauT family transport system substrate-binding protein [Prosthecobacter fusiformis]